MTDDLKMKAQANLKGSIFCLLCALTVWMAVVAATNPNGSFSYVRFLAVLLCWLLFLCGDTLAFLAMRRSEHRPSCLLAIGLITLHSIGSLVGAVFLVVALVILNLEHKVKQQEAEAATNAIYLARAEFQSNDTFYMARYTRATESIKILGNTPVSSLKSKELLESRVTNLANFNAAGVQLVDFYRYGPTNFAREIENSGRPQKEISNILRRFEHIDLKLWNEKYAVIEKTLQVTSNILILNDMLLSNYDEWRISNASIFFDNSNLQMMYLEKAAGLKQYKNELDQASEHLDKLQHQGTTQASTNSSGQ